MIGLDKEGGSYQRMLHGGGDVQTIMKGKTGAPMIYFKLLHQIQTKVVRPRALAFIIRT